MPHLRVLVVEVVVAFDVLPAHRLPLERLQQRLHHVPVADGGGQLQRDAAVLQRENTAEEEYGTGIMQRLCRELAGTF